MSGLLQKGGPTDLGRMAHPSSVASGVLCPAGNRGGPLPAFHDLLHPIPVRGLVHPYALNPDTGSPVSKAIIDRIVYNVYEVLIKGRVSMKEHNSLKSSLPKGGEEDA